MEGKRKIVLLTLVTNAYIIYAESHTLALIHQDFMLPPQITTKTKVNVTDVQKVVTALNSFLLNM